MAGKNVLNSNLSSPQWGGGEGASCLLSTAYFPPIQWFQKLVRYEKAYIERFDNYTKQTYRNRCTIATANGLQSLTVPIVRPEGDKCLMRDIRISSHGNWTRLHLHALMSAYGESPFFDYYIDDLRSFFEKPEIFLFDHNLKIVEKLCELLDIDFNAVPTEEFKPPLIPPVGGELACPASEGNGFFETTEQCDASKGYAIHRVSTHNMARKGAPANLVETRFITSPHPSATSKQQILTPKQQLFTPQDKETVDYRDVIRPKKPLPDPTFTPKEYYQVYADKHGFQPNLSILDLLFNEGPEAVMFL